MPYVELLQSHVSASGLHDTTRCAVQALRSGACLAERRLGHPGQEAGPVPLRSEEDTHPGKKLNQSFP